MQKDVNTIFLNLVRLGIGHYAEALIESACWKGIQNLAEAQGLYAVVLDAIDKLPEAQRPTQTVLLEWIGEVLQGYDYRYEQYCKAISEMAGFYNSHGFKMMVLKGYACSLDWPQPNHRPCGDIDIWQFGKQKEADKVVAREKGIDVDDSHHHHTVFNWGDFTVENHYDFVNVYDYKSSRDIEKIFKDLGREDSHYVEVLGEKVYLPSPNLHALFMIRHLVSHFASTSITLRQILDWAFFVERHTNEINWDWLFEIVEKYHMTDFFNCINTICVEELGFESAIFKKVRYYPSIKERILSDIFEPQYTEDTPQRVIPRLIFMYRRWKSNGWKRELCYDESDWTSFWNGLWYHILKPASI